MRKFELEDQNMPVEKMEEIYKETGIMFVIEDGIIFVVVPELED